MCDPPPECLLGKFHLSGSECGLLSSHARPVAPPPVTYATVLKNLHCKQLTHGATLPYRLNLLPAIVVTFSTIVAYQKSQRNTHNGLQVTVTECATRRRYVYSANSTSADPWRYAAISIECVACNCDDFFNDRGISKKPEKHAYRPVGHCHIMRNPPPVCLIGKFHLS